MFSRFIERIKLMVRFMSMRITDYPSERDFMMLLHAYDTIRRESGNEDSDTILYLILANRNEKWVRRVAAHFAVKGLARSVSDATASKPAVNETLH